MAKAITCTVNEIIEVLDESETSDWSTILADISWNGKPSKGLDIRSYDGKNPLKGIVLTPKALKKLCKALIKRGYLDKGECLELFEEANEIKVENHQKEFDMNDFENMFKEIAEERKYIRDDEGYLRDDKGYIKILRKLV